MPRSFKDLRPAHIKDRRTGKEIIIRTPKGTIPAQKLLTAALAAVDDDNPEPLHNIILAHGHRPGLLTAIRSVLSALGVNQPPQHIWTTALTTPPGKS